MTGCMLTSLNVVRIAAVDCDCDERARRRAGASRDIGTRCSGRDAACAATRDWRRRRLPRLRWRRWRGCGCRRAPRLDGADHVALGDASAAAGALDGGRIDALVGHHLARRRQRGDGGACGAVGGARWHVAAGGCRSRRGVGEPSAPDWRAAGAPCASVIDDRDDIVRRHRSSRPASRDLDEHAVAGRRQLEHDLVGLDVDQVFVARRPPRRPSCAS